MPNQSWEFYQQQESGAGIAYPQWWTCGMGSGTYDTYTLSANVLVAVPWDQMRAVTVSKMMIYLNGIAQVAGAKVRLGIYQNTSSSNNLPAGLVLDAGEITVDNTVGTGIKTLNVNQALQADTRYWATLLANNNVAGGVIGGLAAGNVIPWNAVDGAGSGLTNFRTVQGLSVSGQTYGPLPANFPAVTSANLRTGSVPAIILTFSSVT